MATYHPEPIATDDIELEAMLLDLTERLAAHAHDVWARQRIADGWRWGERRCDERREHPCLIAYAELSEMEKMYDRNAALETIKAVIALGYSIVKVS
jgi:hypothetical protein